MVCLVHVWFTALGKLCKPRKIRNSLNTIFQLTNCAGMTPNKHNSCAKETVKTIVVLTFQYKKVHNRTIANAIGGAIPINNNPPG